MLTVDKSARGECRVCLNVRELVRSHVFPAGVYKRLRNPSHPNPNPVLLTEEVAIPTSKQPTARLLCLDCERRFNENGENWVLANCYQPNNTFPLRDALLVAQQWPLSEVTVCGAKGVQGVEVNQLAYFAASVFWRASVYRPKFKATEGRVNLGRQYEEAFRKYLLGLADFPTDTALIVSVSPLPTPWTNIAWMPSGEKFRNGYLWRFVIPGIIFDLFVGKMLEEPVRKMCMVRSSVNFIFMTDKTDKRMCHAVMMLAAKQIEREKRRN
jgi:hypothetical protein